MFGRRTFLAKSILTSLGIGLGASACTNTEPEASAPAPKKNPNSKASLPIVIATWENDAAVAAGKQALVSGGTALDAVEAAAKVPEADPKNVTVGYGGLPDRDGVVTLDACIMNEKGDAGSVTFLQNIKHPISVARKVMEDTPHVMLSGEGALQFAKSKGFEEIDLLTPEAKARWEEWLLKEEYQPKVNIERHDTIGVLSIDSKGRIAGACTTSGMAFKMHGRVGDSPIIGAGLYVDGEVGGAVATGLGELVMTTLGAFLIVELMRSGLSPQEACEEGIRRIVERYQGKEGYEEFQVGYLAIDTKGEHGAYAVVEGFNYTIDQEEKSSVIEAGHMI
jgi:N4-(beta-N-acetylglucosaminyl)-L-asparaginase